MSKNDVDMTKFTTEELVEDLVDTVEDIAVCKAALSFGITTYSSGSVQERLDTNLLIKEKIETELARRAEMRKPSEPTEKLCPSDHL